MHTQPTNATPVQGPSARRGFSLIELVLVMTIISILAAIAVPRYANALARYRADAAARRVVADLDYARHVASARSTSVTVDFKVGPDCILIQGVSDMETPGATWALELDDPPYRADLVSASFTGAKVIFDGYGVPDSGGTLVMRVGSEVRTVVLNAETGKAAIQ
ncbi:MAG: GspH/FimT family pseudopilin [Phycisphaerales bacterium]